MRILFVTARPPWPGRRGDQARVAGFVRELGGGGGHEISVLCQRGPGFGAAAVPAEVDVETVTVGPLAVAAGLSRTACLGVLGLSRRPFQTGFFDHAAFRRALRRRLSRRPPDVVVLVTSRLGALLDEVPPEIPVVLDLVDALALNFRRRAERDRLLAWIWRWESRRLARWEADLAARSAAVTLVAERDRTALVEGAPRRLREAVSGRASVVPFGLALPDPPGEVTSEEDASEERVVLTGNLGYFPTVDGARLFAREAWPVIRRRIPGARWLLAGARPARAIRRLAELDGVEVAADPPDLRSLVRGARVALAPMRSGSGTPIKILEAMADGIPVVATPSAAAGLDELPGGAVAVAADGAAFADEVSDLLRNPRRARRMARRAREWLEARHALPASARRFETILERVIRGARSAAVGPLPARR